MADARIEKLLYRIIRGRMSFKARDGLFLYIYEPDSEIIEHSHEIYDEAYDEAYRQGSYVEAEILPILIEYGFWNPLDDREVEKIKKDVEETKYQAFKNFYNKKELSRLKRKAIGLEKKWSKAIGKKSSLKHLTCEGAAELARTQWIISQTVKTRDGQLYDWSSLTIPKVLNYYTKNAISLEDTRTIARCDEWKGMWTLFKTGGCNLFGKPAMEITAPQARLVAYSRMYDNVLEHPEHPNEKIIEDDIALDGWFIAQKRKAKKERKEREIESMTSNDKIKNSNEMFVMARTPEEAGEIFEVNDPVARGTIIQRQNRIKDTDGENLKHTALPDVKLDIQMQRQQAVAERFKGGR